MKIKYLKRLEQHNKQLNKDGTTVHENKGLSISEIEYLENIFAPPGKQFPLVFREFLYLAGRLCIYFDPGINPFSSDENGIPILNQELESAQESYHTMFLEVDPEDTSLGTNPPLLLPRSYWAFDENPSLESYLFIYLDEEVIDPFVHKITTYDDTSIYANSDEVFKAIVNDRNSKRTLLQFINLHIDFYLENGYISN